MGTLILILFFAFIGFALYTMYKNINSLMPENPESVWRHLFTDLKFSAQEFYDAIEKKLKEQQVPNTMTLRVEFSEYGELLDGQRTYLRVRSGKYVFDICAAPYGTGFFASAWIGTDVTLLMRILFRIPLIGTYIKNRIMLGTYYAWDCKAMFEESVHRAILETVDAITTQKGIRGLEGEERSIRRVSK